MKIVIENITFDFNIGCRLLKLKHESSPYEQLDDMWDDIVPMTFKEIAEMSNLEHRRIGILCLGLERIVKEVNPKLINSKTLEKTTTWIGADGKKVKHSFKDTYELYEVQGESFGNTKDNWRRMDNCYYVKFKDTSTDREYMIWVEPRSVFNTNKRENQWFSSDEIHKINAIQCIAWTIQTNVPKGNIKEIVRQGDCVFVKPKDSSVQLLSTPRHLTETEYKNLLKFES